MRKSVFILVILVLISVCAGYAEDHGRPAGGREKGISPHEVVFAVFAEDAEQASHLVVLVESIRKFTGRFRESPIWIYVPYGLELDQDTERKFVAYKVDVRRSRAPEPALEYFFSRKVFAAAAAEKQAVDRTEILIWVDEDTVFLKEPQELIPDPGISLGYRPVMHPNIGSLYDEPVDAFWRRVYANLEVSDTSVFPMVTAADGITIRPYFNAGLLVVRPERGILRKWAEGFPKLYEDEILAAMCREDRRKRIFIHQAALTGAILNLLRRKEMKELPPSYNYPLFFDEMFGAPRKFDDISDAVSLRYDVFFRNAPPDWSRRLKGPVEIIDWLKVHFPQRSR